MVLLAVGWRLYAWQSQHLRRCTDFLEATGPTAKELIKRYDLAKHIAHSATPNATPGLVFFGDDYVLRSVYVFVATVV